MPNSSHLLDQCFDEVARQAKPLLGRCVDAAVNSLQASEAKAGEVGERQRIARACWAMMQHRGALTDAYPVRLREAFERGDEDGRTSSLALLSDSSLLALVDDLSVSESLESARLLQDLMPVVEQALAALDARMSSLIGFETVQVEKNPLRPSVFVRVLRDLIAEIERDPEIRSLWLQHLAAPLGRGLCQLYEQLALRLQQANVQEAGYRIRLVDDPQASPGSAPARRDLLNWDAQTLAPTAAGSGEQSEPLPPMTALAGAQTRLDHRVFHDFLAERGDRFEQALDSGYYEQLTREQRIAQAQADLPLLDEVVVDRERVQFRGLPVVDRPARAVSIGSQLGSDHWGPYAAPHERTRVLLDLKQQAERVSQAVGLDLVRKLVNQVARDPLLMAPVREAVVALEPALLRLAMDDPRFFAKDQHPARLLVEQVAQRSFRFNDEFSAEFEQFHAPVREAVNALNALPGATPEPFAVALEHLQEDWANVDQAEAATQEQHLQALRFAEARQALADQVAWEISLRPDVFNAPAVVLDFLYGSWSLVIAEAQLRHPDGDPDPMGFRAVIPDLLWSVRHEVTLRQPRKLFEMLPRLLQRLRAGLTVLDKPAEETASFFDALIRYHEPVLALRRASARSQAGASMPAALESPVVTFPEADNLAEAPRPQVAETPWLAARERVEAGFEDAPVAEAPVAENPAAALLSTSSEEGDDVDVGMEAAGVLASLHVGDWVDLQASGQWLRARLVWANARATLFLFTSRGGHPHTMTRRSCEKLIRQRGLRPLAVRPVVDAAIDAVVKGVPGAPAHACVVATEAVPA
ncbi:MAG: DUF1631 domain-containing protein [Gammaproteobacteria bacterium]|nr:DUF1631 domain-containing protein [Gammaproteobacteria bacterium]